MSAEVDVIVIGAGAAGLMAAIRAAERGRRVVLLEKGKKAGVKILMSGGTRCRGNSRDFLPSVGYPTTRVELLARRGRHSANRLLLHPVQRH